jgi:tetrahydromethanopterin S-methyltransferase subunit G
MAMNVEAEIRELQRRVSEIEGSFAFLTRQVQGVHKDLLSFEARSEERFKSVSDRFDRVDGKIDVVEGKVDNLAKTLPGIIGDALREVLRAQSK